MKYRNPWNLKQTFTLEQVTHCQLKSLSHLPLPMQVGNPGHKVVLEVPHRWKYRENMLNLLQLPSTKPIKFTCLKPTCGMFGGLLIARCLDVVGAGPDVTSAFRTKTTKPGRKVFAQSLRCCTKLHITSTFPQPVPTKAESKVCCKKLCWFSNFTMATGKSSGDLEDAEANRAQTAAPKHQSTHLPTSLEEWRCHKIHRQ